MFVSSSGATTLKRSILPTISVPAGCWRCRPALAILQRPPLTVATGTVEAARAHITAPAERLHLVNRQIKDVTRRLDILVEQLAGPEPEPGQQAEQRDAAILRSLPGVERIILATLRAEARQAVRARNYHALRKLTGVAPVTDCPARSRSFPRPGAPHRRRPATRYRLRHARKPNMLLLVHETARAPSAARLLVESPPPSVLSDVGVSGKPRLRRSRTGHHTARELHLRTEFWTAWVTFCLVLS